jgi:hypothetical protein
VHRLAYNSDVVRQAPDQLAVFQGGPSRTGGSEAPLSELIRVERATRKNSQPAAAQRVALKMGRRLRGSSVTYRFRYAPSYCQSPARTVRPRPDRRPILNATMSLLYARRYTRLQPRLRRRKCCRLASDRYFGRVGSDLRADRQHWSP